MADKIKGITIEIGGDTTGLSKALKGVNAEIKNTQSNLKDVNKLLKLDPTNTELLKQKQKLLGDAVKETKEKLETLKEAEKQAQEQFKNGKISQEQYDALKREIIKTENELKNLEKEARNSNAVLSEISAVAGQFADGAKKISSNTRAISTAASAALVGLGGMAVSAASAADDLNTLAKQTGISTEMLQEAKYAADLIDVSFETFTSSVAKMEGKLRTSEESFTNLGIATRDANDNLLSTEEIYMNAAKALSQIDNETERDIRAQELFGKSAAELAGILDDGGAALQEYGQQAKDAGLIMSQDTLDALNDVNDEIDTLKANLKGTLANSGAKALDALKPVLEGVAKAIGKALEFIGKLSPQTIKLITIILAVVASIAPIAGIIGGIATAIGFLFSPIGLIIAAIAAVIAIIVVLIKHWDDIKKKVSEVVQNAKDKVVEMKDNIVDKFEEIKKKVTDKFEAIKDKIITPIEDAKDKVKGFIDEIQEFFNNMKAKLPEIKLPHFTVTYSVPKNKVGSVVWKDLMGLEGKPNIGVDWYAKAMNNAMLLNSPTIFGMSNGRFLGGGEAGQEVVAGSSTLMSMIRGAVASEINNSPAVQLLEIIANNTGASTSIDINNRELARLVKGVV